MRLKMENPNSRVKEAKTFLKNRRKRKCEEF